MAQNVLVKKTLNQAKLSEQKTHYYLAANYMQNIKQIEAAEKYNVSSKWY